MGNKRLHLGFGDLNEILPPNMAKTFDPTNTSALLSLRRTNDEQYKYDIFKNVGQMRGIVLRVDPGNDDSGASFWNLLKDAGVTTEPLTQLKVRVPEIHAALPEPDLGGDVPVGPHQPIIDLYPSFIAANEDVSKENIAVGDIVIVDWLDRENLSQPIWIKKYCDGPGSFGGKSSRDNGIYYPPGSNGGRSVGGGGTEGKSAFDSSNGLYGKGKAGCGDSSKVPGDGNPPENCVAEGNVGTFSNNGTVAKLRPLTLGATPNQRIENIIALVEQGSGVKLSIPLMMSFIKVESGSRPPTRNTVRFEPHRFLGMRGKTVLRSPPKGSRPDLYGGQRCSRLDKIPYDSQNGTNSSAEWAVHSRSKRKVLKGKDYFICKTKDQTNRGAFNRAFKLDPSQAIKSTSWGSYQVMGWALLAAYDKDPVKALTAYDKDPLTAGDMMVAAWLIKEFKEGGVGGSASSARRAFSSSPPNFNMVAKHYNGIAQVKQYGPKLEKYYNKYSSDIPVANTAPQETNPPTTQKTPCAETDTGSSPESVPPTVATDPPQPPPGILVTEEPSVSPSPKKSKPKPKPKPSRDRAAALSQDRYPGATWRAAAEDTKKGTIKSHENIVIHTVGGSGSGRKAINWFRYAGRKVPTATHFVIQKTGKVTQMHDLNTRVWHAGNLNSKSIGIEHGAPGAEGPPAAFWNSPEGNRLLESSAKLVSWLSDKYNIPKERATVVNSKAKSRGIVSHSEISGHGKRAHKDPGDGFPWERYIQMVKDA